MKGYKIIDLDMLIAPDVEATNLLQDIVSGLSIDHVSKSIENWHSAIKVKNEPTNLKGKKFAVKMLTKLKPKPLWFHEVREIFQEDDYIGDIRLFFFWILQTNPTGFYSTLPFEDGMFINPHNNELTTLYYDKQKLSHLYIMDKSGKCSPNQNYLAFKEVD